MAIDRVDWHWDSALEIYREKNKVQDTLSDEQVREVFLLAGNHIGLFIKWLMDRGYESEDADQADCEKVRNRYITGTDYLLDNCDGKFWDEDVKEELLPFVKDYYEGNKFFEDYAECCLYGDIQCYDTISSEEDYLKLKKKIDIAYDEFCKTAY